MKENTASAMYKVVLPKGKRPGVVRCGPYEPGKAVDVDAAEAVRLVDAKGFEFVDAVGKPDTGAEKRARAEVAAAEAEAKKKAESEAKAKADAEAKAAAAAPKAADAAQEG